MTPKAPFLEGTFWDKFWRPICSRALLFTPDRLTRLLTRLVIAATLIKTLVICCSRALCAPRRRLLFFVLLPSPLFVYLDVAVPGAQELQRCLD